MNAIRRLIFVLGAVAWLALLAPVNSHAGTAKPEEVLRTWYRLVLELVRHTPTYSPPVASRSFAYLGVTAFETLASGSSQWQSLGGQLIGFQALPQREAGETYDEAVAIQAAMASAVRSFFGNTGPTGQRALVALEEKLRSRVTDGVPVDVVTRSEAFGRAVAQHILAWSANDGGAVVENMGFPLAHKMPAGPAYWVPTSVIAQQQQPLLPEWGNNRTFAMPSAVACTLPAPPEYSEDKDSAFYREALEVIETKKNLSPEQRAIARFWSDDPMLSSTPPGHWISIALQILERDNVEVIRGADVLARLGLAEADAFIGCWNSKFDYWLLRPVTYIRRLMDPKWESILTTPPFPEYPSGHSTQSAAAAVVLTDLFGENFAFEDATHEKDGLKRRPFPDFWAAAEEAGVSRLYGGIHFRSAIERGLEQGRCVGKYINALQTRR